MALTVSNPSGLTLRTRLTISADADTSAAQCSADRRDIEIVANKVGGGETQQVILLRTSIGLTYHDTGDINKIMPSNGEWSVSVTIYKRTSVYIDGVGCNYTWSTSSGGSETVQVGDDISPEPVKLGRNRRNVARSSWIDLQSNVISGLGSGVSVTSSLSTSGQVPSARQRKNGGSWTTGDLSVQNEDILEVQGRSPNNYQETGTVNLTVGDQTDSCDISTIDTSNAEFVSLPTLGDIYIAPTSYNRLRNLRALFGPREYFGGLYDPIDVTMAEYARGNLVPDIPQNSHIPTNLDGHHLGELLGATNFYAIPDPGDKIGAAKSSGNPATAIITWDFSSSSGMPLERRYKFIVDENPYWFNTSQIFPNSELNQYGAWDGSEPTKSISLSVSTSTDKYIKGRIYVQARPDPVWGAPTITDSGYWTLMWIGTN